MTSKKWKDFVINVAKNGVLSPIIVTKGFRVIGGGHSYKAAVELGLESVDVVIKDIPESNVPSHMTNTVLQVPELKPEQRAAMVIWLYYEEERQKAEGRSGTRTDLVPNLGQGDGGRTNEILAKKAGIGKSSMTYLIAVYRNRPDLFEEVFSGEFSVNKSK